MPFLLYVDVPEWAEDAVDKVGTFDSSGVFVGSRVSFPVLLI